MKTIVLYFTENKTLWQDYSKPFFEEANDTITLTNDLPLAVSRPPAYCSSGKNIYFDNSFHMLAVKKSKLLFAAICP
jgi:hypothetical protein